MRLRATAYSRITRLSGVERSNVIRPSALLTWIRSITVPALSRDSARYRRSTYAVSVCSSDVTRSPGWTTMPLATSSTSVPVRTCRNRMDPRATVTESRCTVIERASSNGAPEVACAPHGDASPAASASAASQPQDAGVLKKRFTL